MTWTVEAVLEELKGKGSDQTRRTWLRHGAVEPMFGVKFGDLRPLARRIGRDQELARGLWTTSNLDARLLACMVAEPQHTTEAELDAWLSDIDVYFLVDTFVADFASKVPGVEMRALRWIASHRDRTAQAGWDLLSQLALTDTALPDDWYAARLGLIATRMPDYGNWTRRAASNAITAIGLRDPTLEAAARETAGRMGSVEFDPGMTACVMPDPIAMLERTKAYRAGKAVRQGLATESTVRPE